MVQVVGRDRYSPKTQPLLYRPLRTVNVRAMSGEKRHRILECSSKKWNPLFSNNENTENSNPSVKTTRKYDADGDEWNIFLRGPKESCPSILVEEVREFVKGFECDKNWEGNRRAAWLDDRSSLVTTSEGVRIYDNFLTPAALAWHLSVPVWTRGLQQRK